MNIENIIRQEDSDYIISLRRELHMYPELEYDLPMTTALVKRELTANGIPYTEEYLESSVVGFLNPEKEGFTIALRADMDALPVEEKTDLPYASRNPGKMHACGHDAHTAILLGTARALKRVEDQLACRVKLIFQPCEEGGNSGGNNLVNNGVMDDVDLIIGLHADNNLPAGHIGICPGASMAARHRYSAEFFGKTAHAATPHTGHDALAMAVKAYTGIQIMQTRQIDPLQRFLCCIGSLNAGITDNVVPDYAKMMISVRTFDLELDRFIQERIEELCADAAKELGGTAKVTHNFEAYPVINHAALCRKMRTAAEKALGAEWVDDMPIKMCSEDFSYYTMKKPGCFVGMGTRNEALGCTAALHNNDFRIDESGLINGCKTFVQFVLDTMDGTIRSELI